jgi:nicotinamidase-related amidase
VVDAVPYPWPYDGALRFERVALVVAGAQRAWADRSHNAAGVAAAIERVAAAIRAAGGLVVIVRHAAPFNGRGALPPARRGRGSDLVVTPTVVDLVVDAGGIDGFYASGLDDELRGRHVDHLVLCGYGAEAAVDSTLRSANDRGYECLTLSDGVAPFEIDTGRHALSSITMSGGIFGAVAPSDALLAHLPVLETL